MYFYVYKQGPCTWMEANQFTGDFMTSGNTTKLHPDVLNVAWGLPGSAEVMGCKSVSLEHLQPPRHGQNQPQREPGKRIRPGASQSKGEARDRREGEKNTVNCCHLWTNIGINCVFKPRRILRLHVPWLPLLHIFIIL